MVGDIYWIIPRLLRLMRRAAAAKKSKGMVVAAPEPIITANGSVESSPQETSCFKCP